MEYRTPLFQAALNFEKKLPEWQLGICLNTWECFEFGELHRIYYDVCDKSNENSELLDSVEDYVESSTIKMPNSIDVFGRNYADSWNIRNRKLKECLKKLLTIEQKSLKYRKLFDDWEPSEPYYDPSMEG